MNCYDSLFLHFTAYRSRRSSSLCLLIGILMMTSCGSPTQSTEISISRSSLATQYFYPENYGANPDGVIDSTEGIQKAIDAAAESGGPTQVVLSAGTYHLKCSTTTDGACLVLSGIGRSAQVSLVGQGAATSHFLISNPEAGLLCVHDAQNVVVTGFSVDYDPLPFTQGRILFVDSTAKSITVAIDNSDGAGGVFPSLNQFLDSGVMIFDAQKPRLKNIANAMRSVISITSLPVTGIWRLHLGDVTGISRDDRFVMNHVKSHVFTFIANRNIRLTGVAVYSGSYMATVWRENRGRILIDSIAIRRKPGTIRLLSTNADAMHMFDNTASVTIQYSYFDGMADDALNTKSSAFFVTGVNCSHLFNVKTGTQRLFSLGQTLQVINPTTKLARGTAKIVSLGAAPTAHDETTVQLDRDISGVATGDIIFIADLAIPNLLVRFNTYGSFRGLFRIRSSGAVLTNNTFLDATNALIFVSADTNYMEGPSLVNSLNGIYSNANTVQGGDLKLLGVNYADLGSPMLSGEKALLTHPLVFDPEFYSAANPDLQGLDLLSHWMNHGIAEGRQATLGFAASEYLNRYPDLVNAFGSNGFRPAILHYIQGGVAEERVGAVYGSSLVYQPTVYRVLNSDLRGSDAQLAAHWLRHGIYEGRRAHLDFSSTEYLDLYSDLHTAFGSYFPSAIDHYVLHGFAEKREGSIRTHSLVFDSDRYPDYNSDLASLGWDKIELGIHWMLHGIDEGRRASASFSSRDYLNRYKDLADMCGSNFYCALQHFVFHGYAEGRDGT